MNFMTNLCTQTYNFNAAKGWMIGSFVIATGKVLSVNFFEGKEVSKLLGYPGKSRCRRLLVTTGLIYDMMTRSKTLSKSSAFKSGSKADRILTNLCKVLHPGIAIIASAYLLENYKKSYTYIKVIALVYYSLQLFYLPRKNSLSTEKTNVNNASFG